MANYDQLINAFKRKLEESGVSPDDIEDPDALADELVEVVKSRRQETDKNIEFDDHLPIFSSTGHTVHSNQIDHSFETLDFILG